MSGPSTSRCTHLLAAYDDQLRTDAETRGAATVTGLGPLRLATFPGGRGFVTYRDLGESGPEEVRSLVRRAAAFFGADAGTSQVEWKTRGHDRAPGLHRALLEHGFVPEEPESIMLGEARLLAAEVPLPTGVTLRRVTEEVDVRAMIALQDAVFGRAMPPGTAAALVDRLSSGDGLELWVAESRGRVVGAGRLEPVPGTEFAGLWGGAVLEEWRGRGIYRALTAARARSALRLGKPLLHSDSTEYSRPILERSGFVKVSSTTPYQWRR